MRKQTKCLTKVTTLTLNKSSNVRNEEEKKAGAAWGERESERVCGSVNVCSKESQQGADEKSKHYLGKCCLICNYKQREDEREGVGRSRNALWGGFRAWAGFCEDQVPFWPVNQNV